MRDMFRDMTKNMVQDMPQYAGLRYRDLDTPTTISATALVLLAAPLLAFGAFAFGPPFGDTFFPFCCCFPLGGDAASMA